MDMVYLDLSKAFDKMHHGVLLHTIKMLGITEKLGVWLYHVLTGRTHFIRLQGGVTQIAFLCWSNVGSMLYTTMAHG